MNDFTLAELHEILEVYQLLGHFSQHQTMEKIKDMINKYKEAIT